MAKVLAGPREVRDQCTAVGGLLPVFIPLTRSTPIFTKYLHEYDDMYMIVAKSTEQ